MSGFFSSLLGGRSSTATAAVSAATPDSAIYDTTPRLTPGLNPTTVTPLPTPEEQELITLIQATHLAKLLQDLPAEPQDNHPRFAASVWLTAQRILLYLRANKNDLAKTLVRLRSSLEWHCVFRPHAITPESMGVEGGSGKQYVNGYDRGGRPIIYMFPHRQNTGDSSEQLRWVVFNMEQAIRSMPEGATKWTIIIDVSRYSMSQSVPLSVAREFLNILELHYPERLHKALVLNPPGMFVMFYRIVAPFIDPVTKEKVSFVDLTGKKKVEEGDKAGPWVDIREHVAEDQLQSDAGGAWDFRFDKVVYWQELQKSYDAWIATYVAAAAAVAPPVLVEAVAEVAVPVAVELASS
ncbi:hypothetical protein LPJ66_000247 [Kickxella alabastrina]|uniref:Uncharacterized protein n=1 Tax=Kickxella alabastrina TaxID=61397 RepID=A0ACC1IWP1_9FUNG|nr:hypothetical protein LPJ66_000247 [Kickxella alabastrina]